ncbi:MAG: hypothetical protein UT77_C0003G0001, partial [Candidatus Daviesbacteria bacterium GW2011_GWC2_40_12]
TCTAQNPGANYVWTHYWQKCEGALNNCSPLCSKAVNFNIIPPQPTTLYNAACPAPGTATTLSWSRSPGADRYILNVQGNSYNLYDSNPSDPAAFTTSFTGNPAFIAPGNTYTWGVQACKGGFTSSTCMPVRMGQAHPKPAATFPVSQVNPVINTALVPAAEIGSVIREIPIATPPAPVYPMTAGVRPMLIPPEPTATAVTHPPASLPGFRFCRVMYIPIPGLMPREGHNFLT